VEGYEADLIYSASDLTNAFPKKHVEDALQLSEDSFKIIAISSNAVTVQDTRTSQKREKQWSTNSSPESPSQTATPP
jgi:hypothetical protein